MWELVGQFRKELGQGHQSKRKWKGRGGNVLENTTRSEDHIPHDICTARHTCAADMYFIVNYLFDALLSMLLHCLSSFTEDSAPEHIIFKHNDPQSHMWCASIHRKRCIYLHTCSYNVLPTTCPGPASLRATFPLYAEVESSFPINLHISPHSLPYNGRWTHENSFINEHSPPCSKSMLYA